METNSPHNPKFDDWVYLISALTGPLTVLSAAIIALVASTGLVQNDTRARDLTQFATLLLMGGAAMMGTTQPRRVGKTNAAMGKEVNVSVEEEFDIPSNSNTAIASELTVSLHKEDGFPASVQRAEPTLASEEPAPIPTLRTSAQPLQEISLPLPGKDIRVANGFHSPRLKDSDAVESDPQLYDTQP